MKERINALLAFLKVLGCDVQKFESHAMIRFADSFWADYCREVVIKFTREERSHPLVGSTPEWHAAGSSRGELSW